MVPSSLKKCLGVGTEGLAGEQAVEGVDAGPVGDGVDEAILDRVGEGVDDLVDDIAAVDEVNERDLLT